MKLIKINEFHFIKTDDSNTITKAQTEGLEITDIPKNPDDYVEKTAEEVKDMILKAEDLSKINLRPEIISEATRLIKKEINEAEIEAI